MIDGFFSHVTFYVGDSGGPLSQWVGNRWQLVGTTSYVPQQCALYDKPTVFVRVAYFYPWIKSILAAHNEQTPGIPEGTPARRIQTYECNRNAVPCGCSDRPVTFNQHHAIGRTEAMPNSWSMIVSINLDEKRDHICSGTIISPILILTSAYCVQETSLTYPKGISIVAGSQNRSSSHLIRRKIDQAYIYPGQDINEQEIEHDIAILRLSQPLDLGASSPLTRTCLASAPASPSLPLYPNEDTKLVIAAWGSDATNEDEISQMLTQASLSVMHGNEDSCKLFATNPQLKFCASRTETDHGEI
jgi:V8-like Glu-specific endopeptidase